MSHHQIGERQERRKMSWAVLSPSPPFILWQSKSC